MSDREVTKYEVVIYADERKAGNTRKLADVAFECIDDARLYLKRFIKAVPYSGHTTIYHPGTTRCNAS